MIINNDIWIIKPGISVGPLKLGMTKSECINILGPVPDVFKRFEEESELTLAYDKEHLHLLLDDKDKIDQISVFRPRNVSLSGIQLLNKSIREISKDLSSVGIEVQSIDVGLWCKEQGIVLVELDELIDGVEITYPDQN